jgi:hypothetical protein
MRIKIRKDEEAEGVITGPGIIDDLYTVKIPAQLVRRAGFFSGDDIVITVDESSWDSSDNPLTYQLTVRRAEHLPPHRR